MAWCGCAAGAGEHHAPAAAALLARAQLGRVGVGVHEGALSLTAAAQRLRRHRRRRLQGLEPPPRRDRPYHLAVLTPMDHADQTLGALVSLLTLDWFVGLNVRPAARNMDPQSTLSNY